MSSFYDVRADAEIFKGRRREFAVNDMSVVESTNRFLDGVQNVVMSNLAEILALRHRRQKKSDDSFVTDGDLFVQDLVQDQMRLTLPDQTRLISEELAHSQPLTAEMATIVLDPIDGTENFTAGLPEWGVSIACFSRGKHVASMLACPEMNSWIRTGDDIPKFESRIRGYSSSIPLQLLTEVVTGAEYRVLGCCVYNMLNVIRGSFFSFENPKGANSWDILAGLNLALEHGLSVFVEGEPYAGEFLPPTRKYRFLIRQR
ncbi:hypothetical protein M4951_14410 [Blastopirellula sp. J2-11]|uniref:inositol monophosphatase family protein n=1 Tax=Blastopirellula sp. J2-11 TaxID=2943192 RepID=UPI0021C8EFA8|nr:inositol monophosphatase family protein [Blastopirellula sp. J2-11]UUO04583.1 hypothetical protein M4951_14410 [Blastopirellula sp. J2-11]